MSVASPVQITPQQAALAIIAAWPIDQDGCSVYHIRQFAAYVADNPESAQAVGMVARLLAGKTPEEAKGYEFAVVLYDIIGWPEGVATT